MTLYREFTSIDELDMQYLPSATIMNTNEIFTRWGIESARARKFLDMKSGLRFGPTIDEYVDVFPCGTPMAPVHMFIHGGYWHSLSPKEFSFIASGLVECGITVVLNNYSLCPSVSIDEIVRQCRAALKWLLDNIESFDGNPENITVSGHSAGAHLAAMVANTEWEISYGLPSRFLRGICGISGIYYLHPIPLISLKPYLQLTCEQILRNSPAVLVRENLPPTQLFVGGKESKELFRQSEEFSRELLRMKNKVDMYTVDGVNHFTILEGFTQSNSEIFRAISEMCFG